MSDREPISPTNKIEQKQETAKSTATSPSSTPRWLWFVWGVASTLVVMMIFDEVVGLSKVRKGIANLEPEPTVSSNPTPSPEPNSSQQTATENQTRLNNARVNLQFLQAYGFNRAIEIAAEIETKAPLYSQAREDITRWSETILDIAIGRGEDGNYIDAIATAQLVPEEDSRSYLRSQQLIEEWKIKIGREQINDALLTAAKALIDPELASSYHRAIAILGQIDRQQSGYQEAELLIRQWSEKIYLMASDRAASGNLKLAIQTANLVPKNTPAYEDAQKAIARWEKIN